MVKRLRVSLFCEDSGHERFGRAMIERLARQEGRSVGIVDRCSRGGKGRALSEFSTWQRASSALGTAETDVLVVMIDANCHGWNKMKGAVEEKVDIALFPRHVVGCPDPHVERWCLADPQAFEKAAGRVPEPDPGKCERDLYKHLLLHSIEAAGQIVLADPMDFAPEIVTEMDLFKAGKAQKSLKHFVDGLKGALRTM